MDTKNTKLPMDEFNKIRKVVLSTWHTGKDAEDLDESFSYQKKIPKSKNFGLALKEADEKQNTLIQPRAGVALVAEHIRLLKYLQNEGQADLLPTTIDSYTRHNRYEEAELGIKESREAGRSLLNGFPAANYGVKICREVTEAVEKPVEVRHGTPDARLLAEITLAGGFTSFEGGGISYNIPYAKEMPLEKSLDYWKYVDRLAGLYAENGIIINREPFGPLTGTMVPPSVSNAVAIIEGLLIAIQGVQDITLGYGQCGNIYQDIAAVNSLRELSKKYFKKFGFEKVNLSTVFHQWMGGFPADEAKAFGVIAWGATTASFAKVTKVITKTPHEAMGIPTSEANVEGLKITKQLLNMLKNQSITESAVLSKELELINKETDSILESVLKLGDGDVADGVARAFKAGVIDIPFAPSKFTLGLVMPVRDLSGAVRFFNFGNLPFDSEIKEFHKKKLEERSKSERRPVTFQMITDDIYAISKGQLVGTRK